MGDCRWGTLRISRVDVSAGEELGFVPVTCIGADSSQWRDYWWP